MKITMHDAHKGLVKAARKAFIGCSCQRCKVRFMHNILAHIFGKAKNHLTKSLSKYGYNLSPEKPLVE